MKKCIVVLLAAAAAAGVFAQETPAPQFTVGGEMKTGIVSTITEDGYNPRKEDTMAGSKDDAGGGAGRFRLNAEYFHNNLGFKFRINWEAWAEEAPKWPYAFGYGNFFDDQLTVSIGKLGASPWGSGGPEMWKELEAIAKSGGMRIEYKPAFVPGLNVGFVINDFNQDTDEWPEGWPITFLDVLAESVIGASYTHPKFMVRAAVKLDSEVDGLRGASNKEGAEAVYRVEEYALSQFIPGFKAWALGYYFGIGAEEAAKDDFKAQNWLFFEYAPEYFTTQLRFGLDVAESRTVFHVRPNFYAKLFGNLINAGVMFQYAQDFGDVKVYPGSPYWYIEVEPKVQINFAPNAYAAFAYNMRREYVLDESGEFAKLGIEPLKRIQWINLRVGITF